MESHVDLVDGRIALRFPYSTEGVARAKSVPGARWNPKEKFWSYAPDMETCRRLREAMGKKMTIGPALRVWAEQEKVRESEISSVALADPTAGCVLERVPTLAPKLWAAMEARGYQPLAAKFGSMVRNVLIADQPGLGKTVETLATLIESGVNGRVLVVAPRTSLRATWEPEIRKWLSDVPDVMATVVDANTGSRAAREKEIAHFVDNTGLRMGPDHFTLEFLIVNPEMLRAKRIDSKVVFDYPQFSEVVWDAVIVDESHRYLLNANPRSKKCSQWGLGLGSLKSNQRIALSGTPMKGKPRRIWHTLRWLEPERYTSEWQWSKRYFKTEYSRFSATGEQITDNLDPAKEAGFNAELARMMIRRTKAELRLLNPTWAPPDKMYHEVWLPMHSKQEKLYKQMENNTEAEMDGQVLTANGVLAILTRLKQFATSAGAIGLNGEFSPAAPSNKIEWLLDDFIPSREGKLVIASQFSKVIDLVQSELLKSKVLCHKLTGATPDQERQKMIYDFQNNPDSPKVFLLTTTAGGVSVTLDAADDLVLLDETWVPDDQEQVEDRIHRTSRTDHQVNIYYVRSLGTVEQDIAETVELKDTTQKRVLDGRRGVEFAKQKFHVRTSNGQE